LKQRVPGKIIGGSIFSPNPSTMPVEDALNMGAACLTGIIPDNFLRRGPDKDLMQNPARGKPVSGFLN
jgi:hypothetical protein